MVIRDGVMGNDTLEVERASCLLFLRSQMFLAPAVATIALDLAGAEALGAQIAAFLRAHPDNNRPDRE